MLRKIIVIAFIFSAFADANTDVEKIVVTGSRLDSYDSPAVTLVKPADFLVQRISLINDSRDKQMREDELYRTVKTILKASNKDGDIEIGVGKEIVYPITLKNIRLDFHSGKRADTSVVYLYVKTPISEKMSAEVLSARINKFIDAVDMSGRTELDRDGELVLSIVNPEKYRNELLKLIAEDLKNTSSIFGDEFKAEIDGLSGALQWERASVSELRLYLEYGYTLSSD